MTPSKPPTRRLLPPSEKQRRGRYAPLPEAKPAMEPESVEAFLARGGQVQRLGTGDRGQPLVRDIRDRKAQEFKISTAARAVKRA